MFEPVAFLRRLGGLAPLRSPWGEALVPPARHNQVRYYGLLAAQAHDRERLVALVVNAGADPAPDDASTDGLGVELASADVAEPSSCAGYRLRWAQLLARVFAHQVLICPSCGHTRNIIAAITERDVAAKLLAHLGLPIDVPQLAHARPPPQTELWADNDWPTA